MWKGVIMIIRVVVAVTLFVAANYVYAASSVEHVVSDSVNGDTAFHINYEKECKSDTDCDDGLFCTGHESCADMSEKEDGSMMRCVFPEQSPCEKGQICFEAEDKCINKS